MALPEPMRIELRRIQRELNKDVENLGQRIRAAIAEAIDYTCPDLPVSASVGVLQVTAFEELSLEILLARADQLMYQAKKTGKNQVLVQTL